MKKKILRKKFWNEFHLYFYLGIGIAAALLLALGINQNISPEPESEETSTYTLSEEPVPAIIEGDQGELIELESVPTMEEVDGGQFKDIDTGLSTSEGEYAELGWSETYNVSSPEAFKNDTLNRCIIANNYYGAQCVSLARVFWWSYANRDVSTCGTGMAKGMMNCAEENAGNDFLVYWADNQNEIQAGDWLVFNGGQYGHIGMALGPVVNGYVALLGENQGGRSCGQNVGGSATNIININIKNLIGFYRPKAYVKPAPTPTPEPVYDCKKIEVKAGDTLGDIMLNCTGDIVWGEGMNNYARQWYSLTFQKYLTVYDGWSSENGVGLFAGDTIEYRGE